MLLLLLLQQKAALLNNDSVAEALLQNGNRFGRQHVVFRSKHAYPAYVVEYRIIPDKTLPLVRAQCSAQGVSVSVGRKRVYDKTTSSRTPEDTFAIVVVNINTLQTAKATAFNIHNVAAAKAMIRFIASLGEDEIGVVAATKRCIPRNASAVVVDVLRALRSVGGSLHVLDCPYVLVCSKHPCLLNGLVHEDHQPGTAAVSVDVRVIQHNRGTIAPCPQMPSTTYGNDVIPARWQFQDNRSLHGATWKDIREWSSQLTAAYRAGQARTMVDDRAVDLVKMKMGGLKIRCLNWKGETLSPLCCPTDSSVVGGVDDGVVTGGVDGDDDGGVGR